MEKSKRKEWKMKSYGDCIYCGGKVVGRKERLDYRYHGQLFIIENVTAGVCIQCGERFLKANVAHMLEKLASSSNAKVKMVTVPVLAV